MCQYVIGLPKPRQYHLAQECKGWKADLQGSLLQRKSKTILMPPEKWGTVWCFTLHTKTEMVTLGKGAGINWTGEIITANHSPKHDEQKKEGEVQGRANKSGKLIQS